MACMYKRNRDRQQAKPGRLWSSRFQEWDLGEYVSFIPIHTKMPTTARETSTQYNRVWLAEQTRFQSHSPYSKLASVCKMQQKMSKPKIPTHKHPASSISSFIKLLTLSLRLTREAWWSHAHDLVTATTPSWVLEPQRFSCTWTNHTTGRGRARTGPEKQS